MHNDMMYQVCSMMACNKGPFSHHFYFQVGGEISGSSHSVNRFPSLYSLPIHTHNPVLLRQGVTCEGRIQQGPS